MSCEPEKTGIMSFKDDGEVEPSDVLYWLEENGVISHHRYMNYGVNEIVVVKRDGKVTKEDMLNALAENDVFNIMDWSDDDGKKFVDDNW